MSDTHGKYVGPLLHLRGKTALLRFPPEEAYLVAQFDDCKARRSGLSWPQEWHDEPHSAFGAGWWEDSETPPLDALGYGWHSFKKEEFEYASDQKQEL